MHSPSRQRVRRLEAALPPNQHLYANLVASLDDGDTLASMRRYFAQTHRIHSSIWPPYFQHSRSTPGFKALVRDYGLVGYWRATGRWGDLCRPAGTDDFVAARFPSKRRRSGD